MTDHLDELNLHKLLSHPKNMERNKRVLLLDNCFSVQNNYHIAVYFGNVLDNTVGKGLQRKNYLGVQFVWLMWNPYSHDKAEKILPTGEKSVSSSLVGLPETGKPQLTYSWLKMEHQIKSRFCNSKLFHQH